MADAQRGGRLAYLIILRDITESKQAETELKRDDANVAGFVFKIQANMDPNHRDRVAFLRLCSGEFRRGMRLKTTDGKTINIQFGQEGANSSEGDDGDGEQSEESPTEASPIDVDTSDPVSEPEESDLEPPADGRDTP